MGHPLAQIAVFCFFAGLLALAARHIVRRRSLGMQILNRSRRVPVLQSTPLLLRRIKQKDISLR